MFNSKKIDQILERLDKVEALIVKALSKLESDHVPDVGKMIAKPDKPGHYRLISYYKFQSQPRGKHNKYIAISPNKITLEEAKDWATKEALELAKKQPEPVSHRSFIIQRLKEDGRIERGTRVVFNPFKKKSR